MTEEEKLSSIIAGVCPFYLTRSGVTSYTGEFGNHILKAPKIL